MWNKSERSERAKSLRARTGSLRAAAQIKGRTSKRERNTEGWCDRMQAEWNTPCVQRNGMGTNLKL